MHLFFNETNHCIKPFDDSNYWGTPHRNHLSPKTLQHIKYCSFTSPYMSDHNIFIFKSSKHIIKHLKNIDALIFIAFDT